MCHLLLVYSVQSLGGYTARRSDMSLKSIVQLRFYLSCPVMDFWGLFYLVRDVLLVGLVGLDRFFLMVYI